jgi:hypothetical protein
MPIVTPDRAIHRFSFALDAYPAGFSGNRLNLLLVGNATPICSAEAYLKQLDDLPLLEERREYLLDEHSAWPFPRINLDDRPDPWLISEQLFERFEDARLLIPTQQQVGRMLERRARLFEPAVVALVIVDGLSYYDLPNELQATPCLVEGISITEYGYREVVGSPSISRRLFALGYFDQVGFTYYPTERKGLSSDIHDTFSSSQIVRVKSFDEVLAHLNDKRFRRGYVQVTLAGLDEICHSHHDYPPRRRYLDDVLSRFDALVECLSRKNVRVLACLTADHGILWRDVIEDRLEVADDLFQGETYLARYIKGTVLRPYGKLCRSLGQNYTLLRIPWMTRKFKNNEWGVHGGISAWESIVPLLIRQV